MKKILFLDTVHENLENGFKELGWECIDGTDLDFLKVAKLLPDVHGIVIRSRFTLDACFLQHATQLQFIARSGAGMENIEEAYCKSRGILLFNAPEGNRQAVAEHAIGMLLSLFNNIVSGDIEVKAGKWDREGNRGIELSERTVGLIGYGNNGSATAKALSGFGCRILAYDKYKSGFGNEFVEEVSLEKLKEEIDVLSFHIPQTEETIGMFDEKFVNDFANDFYLLNLSRGKVVQTSVLVNALKSGKVLGAGLDVLEFEKTSFENFFDQNSDLPKDFQYLVSSDKVILSPHVGGWTTESYRKLSDVLLEKVKNALNNKALK